VKAQDKPAAEIAARNPWYVASQFDAQMRTAGRRRVIEERWQAYERMIETWRRSAPGQRLSILDAGCGDGINLVGLSHLAVRRRWPMRLVGLDYNTLRLDRARAIAPQVSLQCGALYALPYAATVFDVVVCAHVLEHVPHPARALKELGRVLAHDGLLIVAVPNEGCRLARLRNTVLQPAIGRTTDHVNFFTIGTLTTALTVAGFSVVDVVRETFFFPVSYVNVILAEFRVGHAVMKGLRWLWPSQAGGLIVAATRRGPSGA
jgi:SAM-dependent methyltransferase